MPGFVYRAIAQNGKEIKGNVTATNIEQATSKLKADGLIVTKIDPENIMNKDLNIGFGTSIKPRDYSVFCRQFVAIIKAGVSVINALQMMSEQTENKALKAAVIGLVDDLGKGETLSSAMRRQKAFPSIFVNLVAAGEATGSLETSFERMALQYEKESQLKAIIKKATTYPIMVLFVAIGVIFLMMTFVIPNFMAMFADMDVEMPAITMAVIHISDFFVGYWWAIIIVAIIVFFAIKAYAKTVSGKVLFSTLKLRFPGVGQLQTKTNCATFARTLSTLVRAGVPMIEALDITSNSMDQNILFQRAVKQARDQVANGVALSKPLKMTGLFPPMVVHMVSIGEETGNLEGMLTNVAEYYEEEVASATEQMMAVLEPLIIVLLAGVVGVVIMAIFSPMLTMYDALGSM